MPKDKIWQKICDHGDNLFKICLQILNIDNLNAKESTNEIACMQAKDNRETLITITNTKHRNIYVAHIYFCVLYLLQ